MAKSEPAKPLATPAHTQDPKKASKPFDIDQYLNPYIPRSPLYLLPASVSYFFGHRSPQNPTASTPSLFRRYHNTVTYTSIFVGTFCGLAIIENVFLALPPLSGQAVPIIIASFGAAAILEYNSIESPLAQPRNLILGHFFSAVVAVGITKLFEHLPEQRFEDLRWLAGALSVGAASILMSATRTVHPPAGATALLAATNVEIQVLGWWLLPLVLLASMLMLTSALVLNNLAGRRYPVYWWTPIDLKALRDERRKAKTTATTSDTNKDVEKGPENQSPSSHQYQRKEDPLSDDDTETGSHAGDLCNTSTQDAKIGPSLSYSSASRTPHHIPETQGKDTSAPSSTSTTGSTELGVKRKPSDKIIISKHHIIVPEWLELNNWEDEVLRILMERLKDSGADLAIE